MRATGGMSTPMQALLLHARVMLWVGTMLLLLALLVLRVYMFCEAYSSFSLRRTEEAWLRQRCREPDFFSNMRQHTDLCAQVEQGARASILLHALNVVCTTAHLCGQRQCADYLNDLVVRGFAWPLALVLCLFVLMVPSIITSLARHGVWHSFDASARRAHGFPMHAQIPPMAWPHAPAMRMLEDAPPMSAGQDAVYWQQQRPQHEPVATGPCHVGAAGDDMWVDMLQQQQQGMPSTTSRAGVPEVLVWSSPGSWRERECHDKDGPWMEEIGMEGPGSNTAGVRHRHGRRW